jgi:hypothetical protein
VQAKVTDGGKNGTVGTVSSFVTVNVLNVDEPPYFVSPQSVLYRTLPEAPTVVVGDSLRTTSQGVSVVSPIDAVDPEPGVLTLTIVGGKFASAFTVGAVSYVSSSKMTRTSIEVASTVPINYEELFPTYSIELLVSVRDIGGNVINGTVVIAVDDVNEVPVVPAQHYYIEDAKPVSVQVDAYDPDSPGKTIFSQVNYTIVGGNNDSLFSVNPTSGVITASPIVYDDTGARNVFPLIVRVMDRSGMFADGAVTLEISNQNNPPQVIVGNSTGNVSIPENSALDTFVSSVTVTDSDVPDVHTVQLAGDIRDRSGTVFFKVARDAARVRGFNILVSSGVIDFEAQATLLVRVEVRSVCHHWRLCRSGC